MHDVLTKVVSREAAKLLAASEAQEALLPESSLATLEILSRCAKALKIESAPPAEEDETTTEEALAVVDG